jgi:Delta7-sterol 5-desaturase
MEHLPNFSEPLVFVALTVGMFVVIIGRYFVVAGLFHLWFNKFSAEKWGAHRLGKKTVPRSQYLKEIRYSLITSLLFSVAGAFTAVLWQKGYTRLYFDVNEYSWWYLPVSLFISMFLHETYYYWLHRWMHQPKVFRVLHKVHHDSHTTSAWTAFSFHPLEGILQAIILPVTIMIIPMHIYVLLVQLTIMTFSSVINHLEIELYPKLFQRSVIGKWIIGATHHSLHHKQFKYNYGLYFTLWDKWKNTESPTYTQVMSAKSLKK